LFFLIELWNGFSQIWNGESGVARDIEEVISFFFWVFLVGVGIRMLNYKQAEA
jgi:hypothetical protein